MLTLAPVKPALLIEILQRPNASGPSCISAWDFMLFILARR